MGGGGARGAGFARPAFFAGQDQGEPRGGGGVHEGQVRVRDGVGSLPSSAARPPSEPRCAEGQLWQSLQADHGPRRRSSAGLARPYSVFSRLGPYPDLLRSDGTDTTFHGQIYMFNSVLLLPPPPTSPHPSSIHVPRTMPSTLFHVRKNAQVLNTQLTHSLTSPLSFRPRMSTPPRQPLVL